MKKLALFMAVMVTATAAFAQGSVLFNNRVVGSTVFEIGLGAPGDPGTLVSLLEGTGYSAQVWGGLTADSLAPATPITDFRTGAAAGYVNGVTAILSGVPLDAPSAFIQVRAWDNMTGTVNTWADVLAADPTLVASGMSETLVINAIGGNLNPPPNLVGFNDFNIAVVPEPSTIALGILGGLALLVRFRKK